MFTPEAILKDAVEAVPAPSDLVVAFCGRDQIVGNGGLPTFAELPGIAGETAISAGCLDDGRRIFGLEMKTLPETVETAPSRLVTVSAESDVQFAIARAREMAHWHNRHRFCGACGKPLMPGNTDIAMICPDCGSMYYPQVAPAVIVAITQKEGKEILLAHNQKFNGVYSLVAGFVEAGETAEHAVHREILEEVGIKIKNVKYLTSQAWPYPNSLMLAFLAEYDSGNITPNGTEIDDANWFSKDNMPPLPIAGSVAKRIIESLGFAPAP